MFINFEVPCLLAALQKRELHTWNGRTRKKRADVRRNAERIENDSKLLP
jgi:hypothetical protein